MSWFRGLRTGLKNLWYWLPIIWSDRQWSDSYICIILAHKLQYHRKYLQTSKWCMQHVGIEKDIKKIHTCELLLRRIIDDDYLFALNIDWHYDKNKDFSALLWKETLCHTLNWAGDKRWLYYSDYMKKQDLDLLCKLINKHLFSWWD